MKMLQKVSGRNRQFSIQGPNENSLAGVIVLERCNMIRKDCSPCMC